MWSDRDGFVRVVRGSDSSNLQIESDCSAPMIHSGAHAYHLSSEHVTHHITDELMIRAKLGGLWKNSHHHMIILLLLLVVLIGFIYYIYMLIYKPFVSLMSRSIRYLSGRSLSVDDNNDYYITDQSPLLSTRSKSYNNNSNTSKTNYHSIGEYG